MNTPNIPPVVRLYNEYSSSTGNDHEKTISVIMEDAMKDICLYLEAHNICPRDAMGSCIMTVTQQIAAYTLKRAFELKRKEKLHDRTH